MLDTLNSTRNFFTHFWKLYSQDVNLLEKHGTDSMMVLNMVCVAPQHSGKGISIKMIKWTEERTKKLNVKFMTAETTGIASAKIFGKCGFSRVKELEYNEYVKENGDRPLADLDPHVSCIIWEKMIDPS